MFLLVLLALALVAIAVLPFRSNADGVDEFCKVECAEHRAKGMKQFYD